MDKKFTVCEEWKEYDDHGNKIHYKDTNGLEQWWEYNEYGKCIHYNDTNNFEKWYEYDEYGNEVYTKTRCLEN